MKVISTPQIDLSHMDNEIDFTLKPFNRRDVYSVVLFINPVSDEEVEVDLATKHPVKFVPPSPYSGIATSVSAKCSRRNGRNSACGWYSYSLT